MKHLRFFLLAVSLITAATVVAWSVTRMESSQMTASDLPWVAKQQRYDSMDALFAAVDHQTERDVEALLGPPKARSNHPEGITLLYSDVTPPDADTGTIVTVMIHLSTAGRVEVVSFLGNKKRRLP